MTPATPEELRRSAAARAYGTSASARLDNSRGMFNSTSAPDPILYARTVHAETLPTVRITPELSERLADYANTNHLNMSETVRTLLTAGLDALEAS